jgi:hypothetical protein
MSLYASLNGLIVTDARVTVPYQGRWVADVKLDHASDISPSPGACTLQIAGLSLVGTLFRTSALGGAQQARIVGGYGGWANTLPAKYYQHDVGVRLSVVLGDAARECGEKLGTVTDRVVGQAYTRLQDDARATLDLFAAMWFVAPDGTTQIADRSAKEIASPFTATHEQDGASGRYTVTTENPEDWVPGNTFTPVSGTQQKIQSVDIALSAGALRVEVTCRRSNVDQLRAALSALVASVQAEQRFFGAYEYSVAAQNGNRIDANPTDGSLGLPPVTSVPMRFTDKVTLPVGYRVLVGFVNGQPTRPYVAAGDPDASPELVAIAGTGPAVARVGDTVTISQAQFTAAGPSNSGGPVTIAHDMQATITSGSSKVSSG